MNWTLFSIAPNAGATIKAIRMRTIPPIGPYVKFPLTPQTHADGVQHGTPPEIPLNLFQLPHQHSSRQNSSNPPSSSASLAHSKAPGTTPGLLEPPPSCRIMASSSVSCNATMQPTETAAPAAKRANIHKPVNARIPILDRVSEPPTNEGLRAL